MIRLGLGVVLVVALGVGPVMAQADGDPPDLAMVCRAAVDGMNNLMADLTTPEQFGGDVENPHLTENDFDPNAFFEVLDRLSVEEGYVLDYVYMFEFSGSRPFLYTRLEDAEPFADFAEFRSAWDDNTRPSYLEHIVTDGTPAGTLQLVVLGVMGEQFYLTWHANYNDLQVLCDKNDVEAILGAEGFGIEFTPEQIEGARALILTPVVKQTKDASRVAVVTFTKWGGFVWTSVMLKNGVPHPSPVWENEVLVEYDCGILF